MPWSREGHPRPALRHLDAQREQGLAEQGMGLPRRQLVHQRPDPDQDARGSTRAASRSTRRQRPTRTRRSSGTSTTSWANRSRSASAARLTNYGAVDKEIWVAVNSAATGSMTPEEGPAISSGQDPSSAARGWVPGQLALAAPPSAAAPSGWRRTRTLSVLRQSLEGRHEIDAG